MSMHNKMLFSDYHDKGTELPISRSAGDLLTFAMKMAELMGFRKVLSSTELRVNTEYKSFLSVLKLTFAK